MGAEITKRGAIDEYADRFLDTQGPYAGHWIILIDGVQVTTATRKSRWVSIGAAKNALRYEFFNTLWRLEEREKLWSDFLKRRVEFRKVKGS